MGMGVQKSASRNVDITATFLSLQASQDVLPSVGMTFELVRRLAMTAISQMVMGAARLVPLRKDGHAVRQPAGSPHVRVFAGTVYGWEGKNAMTGAGDHMTVVHTIARWSAASRAN